MKKIIIRKAGSKDAQSSIKLIDYVWRSAYKHIFPENAFLEREKKQETRFENFAKKCQNNDVLTLVAECDNKIVGLLSGQKISRYDFFAKQNYADLEILYILPEYQGFGISTKMKNIFIDWLKQNQLNKFVIGVLKENEHARKVYEKWGGKLEKYSNFFKVSDYNADEVFYTYTVK